MSREQVSANFSPKIPAQGHLFILCGSSGFRHNYSTLSLWFESSHRQFINGCDCVPIKLH